LAELLSDLISLINLRSNLLSKLVNLLLNLLFLLNLTFLIHKRLLLLLHLPQILISHILLFQLSHLQLLLLDLHLLNLRIQLLLAFHLLTPHDFQLLLHLDLLCLNSNFLSSLLFLSFSLLLLVFVHRGCELLHGGLLLSFDFLLVGLLALLV
jgi:hypothetical protein